MRQTCPKAIYRSIDSFAFFTLFLKIGRLLFRARCQAAAAASYFSYGERGTRWCGRYWREGGGVEYLRPKRDPRATRDKNLSPPLTTTRGANTNICARGKIQEATFVTLQSPKSCGGRGPEFADEHQPSIKYFDSAKYGEGGGRSPSLTPYPFLSSSSPVSHPSM